MSEKDYKRLMDLAAKLLEDTKSMTKEEALDNLCFAGILDKKGNFTKPYRNLSRVVKPIKK